MNTRIVISPAEKTHLFKSADGRNNSKSPEASRYDAERGNLSNIIVNRLGILGEWAAGQFLKLPINLSYGAGGDGGCDLTFPGGAKAAVKYNHRGVTPWLMVTEWPGDSEESLKDLKAVQVIVLTHGQCRPNDHPAFCQCESVSANPDVSSEVTVAGWLYVDDFMQLKERQFGDKWVYPVWAVPATKLRPPEKLLKIVAIHFFHAEWEHRYQERLGILCGGAEPTQEQIVMAKNEADATIWALKKEFAM